MSLPKRKLGFYNCYIHEYKDGKNDRGIFDKQYFVNLLNFIKNTKDKLRNDESSKKIYLLKEISCLDDKITRIIFATGKYGHSPDYLSSVDGTIRGTSKKICEAEEELTHICIKIKATKAIFLLEERQIGVSAKKFIWYLNEMAMLYEETLPLAQKNQYKFFVEDYPVENIDKIFASMEEIKKIEIYTKKKEVQDSFKKYADIESPLVRDEICVTIKAKPRESIPRDNTLNKIKKLFNCGDGTDQDEKKEFNRIRITGKESTKIPIIFDTEMIRKKSHVEAQINENGVVNSIDIFSKMVPLIKELE